MPSPAPPPARPSAARRRLPRDGGAPLLRPRALLLRPRALLLALIATLGLGPACGEPAPERLAVVARDLAWTRVGGPPGWPPLSASWDLTAGSAGDPAAWRLSSGDSATPTDAGGLLLTGTGRVALDGPGGDPELHRWLLVSALPAQAESLRVQWKATGERFIDERTSSPFAMPPAGQGVRTFAVPIDSLRGVRGAADAREGFDRVRLLFEGPLGTPVRVRVDAVHLVCDLDEAEGGVAPGPQERGGERRQGLAARLPALLEAPVAPGPRDRLRLALAVAGASAPLRVTLDSADGRLPPRVVELQPGAGWHELSVDLAPLGGQPARLRLSAREPGELDGADPRAVLLVGSVLRLAPVPADDRRPSVLLYVEDTLRADRLGAYGYPFPTDPWLSACAEQGVLFERVLAASSWTRPAVSTMLTSLEPARHGNRTHTARVPDDVTTLAEAFADAGWLTASFVTNYHAGAWSGLDQGFDVHREPTADGASQLASTLTSAALADSLDAFLERHADERVFVWVHSLDPHEPYQPPDVDRAALEPTLGEREPVRAPGHKGLDAESIAYDGEVRHNDRMLARLDATLRRLGLADDMLLAFTSDHGEAFGEHGQVRHRQSLHGEELLVPWVLRWPASLPAGLRVGAWAGHLDLAPSLAGLAGVPAGEGWRGRDLSAVLRGEREASDEPQLADVSYAEPRAGVADELTVVHGELKLIAAIGPDGGLTARALYDLERDPGEHDDLLPVRRDSPELAAMLDWAADRWRDARAAAADATAAPMDPAMREWMIQMGYLQATDR